jgi:hypothetical protein
MVLRERNDDCGSRAVLVQRKSAEIQHLVAAANPTDAHRALGPEHT